MLHFVKFVTITDIRVESILALLGLYWLSENISPAAHIRKKNAYLGSISGSIFQKLSKADKQKFPLINN